VGSSFVPALGASSVAAGRWAAGRSSRWEGWAEEAVGLAVAVGLGEADAVGLGDEIVGGPVLTSRFTAVPRSTCAPAANPCATTLPAATSLLATGLIEPALSPAPLSSRRAWAVVSPATLGTVAVCETGGGWLFSFPRKSNQPFVEFGPMRLLRMPNVPRKNRIAATTIKGQGMRLRRRPGAGRAVGALLVGLGGTTGARCVRVGAAPAGTADRSRRWRSGLRGFLP
jgi:hypothetical protein